MQARRTFRPRAKPGPTSLQVAGEMAFQVGAVVTVGYVAGKVINAAGGLVGAVTRGTARLSDVWRLTPFARGVAIENALGRNLPGNFPVIDRFSKGVATSIKSLDLGAKSYQNVRTLARTVRGYIDDVAAFNGRSWGGATVRGADISGRALELAVPAGGGTAAQGAVLQSAVEYGRSVGVSVGIVPF